MITVKTLKKIGPVYKEDGIRLLRDPLLKAYDIYKINVADGEEKETVFEKEQRIAWKNKLLKLDETAFYEIPPRILYYVESKYKHLYNGD